MADEHDVRILTWPEGVARLTHTFDLDRPCPVSIRFENTPANVQISTSDQPLNVNMGMEVSARDPIPVCIAVCEPICARSSYRIAITVFDEPVAQINLQGETRFFNCDQEPPVKKTCVNFTEMKSDIEFLQPVTFEGLVFAPLGDPIHTSTIGSPPNQVKLTFPRTGVRIELPQPSSNVSLDVSNYADPPLDFSVYAGTTLVSQFTRIIDGTLVTIDVAEYGVTAVEIRGGDNEASIIQVCYAISDQG